MTNSAPLSSGSNILRNVALGMLLVSSVGFVDATYLAVKYFEGVPPPCTLLAGCDTVTTSAYAVIFGIPVALLGALYYGAMLIGAIAYLDSKKQRIVLVLSWVSIAGLLASAWFIYLQLFVINAICLYCMVSAATSTLLFFLGMVALKKFKDNSTL